MADQVEAAEALKALEPLVGEWAMSAAGPDGVPWPGDGRSTFAWHESGAHLVQRAGIDAPGAPHSVCIIGCDAGNGEYVQLYSDDRGVCRIYSMTLTDSEWTLTREGHPFSQRYRATISGDGQSIEGVWEKAEDGVNFSTDFHLNYRRV